jgi:NAD(P)-dependent dehydrogenase (short-subunit alcohol dehydrogenase family)
LYAKVKAQKDHIDILFANAGLGEVAPSEAITETHFDISFSVNVKGLLFTAQKALLPFKNGGSIIISSKAPSML